MAADPGDVQDPCASAAPESVTVARPELDHAPAKIEAPDHDTAAIPADETVPAATAAPCRLGDADPATESVPLTIDPPVDPTRETVARPALPHVPGTSPVPCRLGVASPEELNVPCAVEAPCRAVAARPTLVNVPAAMPSDEATRSSSNHAASCWPESNHSTATRSGSKRPSGLAMAQLTAAYMLAVDIVSAAAGFGRVVVRPVVEVPKMIGAALESWPPVLAVPPFRVATVVAVMKYPM